MTTIETQAGANTVPSGKRFFSLAGRYGTFVAFLALILFNVIFTPNFLSLQTLNVNLTQVATIVIVAIGMTLVIATGGIDLSVGSLMAIAGALAPMIFMGTLFPVPNMPVAVALALVLPVAVTGLFGLFNGFLVTRFAIQPIIATLVLFIAGRGIAQVMTNGNLQVFRNEGFQFVAMGRVAGIPAQVILMVVIAAIAWAAIRYTVFGRQIIAVGGNEKAARLTGMPVHRVKLLVYMISGALAGVAGLIVVARNSASDANLVGLGMELDAIAAVAVGGTLLTGGRANIIGTVIGALVIQLVRYTLLANGVPDAAALIVKAALIVLAVFIQQRAGKS
ncbi:MULTISPECIES: ABC transporter permease [unclassified Sinorhizobium]|uniref:ABC transporter permease n=1 Tax=unclassified Sinorhizobium TaxID=2613772 RepID=UPI0024C3E0E5|nr:MULTISPECIES: ABC transporter permease [unclassified Sinorhizobium]MDK1373691.1 ABC transporter permease [Sinorhizobium sp. 6-70]MDK1477747.1 ABC transporter permease [Sinorhizobium sp. 6-117]